MTAVFALHVLLVVMCTDLNTRPLELQYANHAAVSTWMSYAGISHIYWASGR